jgi:ankyrin repeat protein
MSSIIKNIKNCKKPCPTGKICNTKTGRCKKGSKKGGNQCECKTVKGERCTKKAKNNSMYCTIHKNCKSSFVGIKTSEEKKSRSRSHSPSRKNNLNEITKKVSNTNSHTKYTLLSLLSACELNNIKLVKEIIASNFNLNLQDNQGKNALILACSKGRKEIVKLLIESKVNLDLQDNNNDTALIVACQKNRKEIVQELIKAGANLDLQNNDGATGLIYSSVRGYSEIMKKLIKAGAKLDLFDKKGGMTAFLYGCVVGQTTTKDLIKVTTNINIKSKSRLQETGLMLACDFMGNIEIVKELIKAGANLDLQDTNGETALMRACKHGHEEIIKELIRAGANFELKNKNGQTALMIANKKNNEEKIEKYIKKYMKEKLTLLNKNIPELHIGLKSNDILNIINEY